MEEKRLIYIEVHQLKKQGLKITQISRRTKLVNARIKLTVFARYDFTLLPKNQNKTPIEELRLIYLEGMDLEEKLVLHINIHQMY